MKPLPRIVVWLTLLALALGACWLASGRGVSQGDGAKRLLRGAKASRTAAAMLPRSAIIPPSLPKEYHFTVRAIDNENLSSDESSEVVFTNESVAVTWVTLAWDWSGTNIITNYTVSKWRTDRPTNTFNSGTNMVLTVRLLPLQLTNFVVTVTGSNISWIATNPPGARYWRATNAAISGVWQ